ncbi:hypothetical protein SUGI_0577300 [Cryptomeria japonica]|uniref:uncharacterized protein LOC131037415 n=1 Tax=Cryptomeria japonica TaxID=3369 RepID=UPI002408D454|nr:uncharacterized protein LOC131037415 [Cryptomeria japonica]GLJ29275.1 hypothetical protein SUGI_0577300 [Cryptomeria japonica]
MVGSAVGVKKLWKSLRTSVGASGRLIKQKLRKKKGPVDERFDHYNFSDDDEGDGKLGKKLRSWKLKAMGCIVGDSVIESGKDHFVYVTDLYSSVPPPVPMDSEDTEKIKAGLNDGASGSSPAEDRISVSSDEQKLKAEASEASNSKMKKKSVWWAELEKGTEEEVDGHADEFISKFYDDIRLQRQNSFVEYREMLERGTTSS